MRPLRTTRSDVLFLGGAFVLALAVRLLSFPAATAGGLHLVSPDCYGHLRRSASVARNFPRVPVRDAWLNHPEGGIFIWPPGFDLLVGGTARVAYGAAAAQEGVASSSSSSSSPSRGRATQDSRRARPSRGPSSRAAPSPRWS